MTTGYAVLDTETTGFTPGWHRVVEIGVVLLDVDGAVEGEWCTLINPERDLGPQHVHGISAANVRSAPLFADIAGDLAELLAGRVLVGHNLSFDVDFLAFEYGRLGLDVPLAVMPGLCTMQLAERYLDIPARSLAACCAAVGVPLIEAHSAQHDAYATAGLLASYLQVVGSPVPWQDLLASASQWRWPELPMPTGRTAHRGAVVGPREHFLTRLPEHGARSVDPGALDAYLTLLDAALLDRHLSLSEEDGLIDNALSAGLGRTEVLGAHRRYLSVVACAAAQEGVLPAAVVADLVTIAALIGLSVVDVDRARCHAVRELSSAGTGALVASGALVEPGAVAEAGDLAESGTAGVAKTQGESARCAGVEFETVARDAAATVCESVVGADERYVATGLGTAAGAAAGTSHGLGSGALSAAWGSGTEASPSDERRAEPRSKSIAVLGKHSETPGASGEGSAAAAVIETAASGPAPATIRARRVSRRRAGHRSQPTAESTSGPTADAEHAAPSKPGPQTWGRFRLCTGDRVVFTGQTRSPRERWSLRAVSAGLVEGSHVTRKTRLVVAADPDSLSGKARRARNYGIPIVTEEAFTKLLEKMLDTERPNDSG
ncbi:exonuclease domain-containing protein [Actinoalloteichus hymeniacidonis]|uniref:DNA polymerase III epsilon subunit-like 3'-5' exonuclease n=1 Tax=Actinoalloteichus hymeniacidonis TaxID=340345 RepID=A0AAC9HSU7_9PSEU|nr:exonuclease domain-containing protein [Actinoalloteichus hymeniacidonis]AOS64954.1 DNA polymerase III epsilon subunit-like 3'-5' exonuclease [Actinoalloteichus hymeniacidonis]MBB5906971.1 DNA polymerase III epsilon subunit-like protein [Actinoalloteichus hymeniacidonis]